MRDLRWVNRFFFAWNDTLFYDPLDTDYVPRSDHFLADLDPDLQARFVRSGIWWSYRHNAELPAQGWKIHLSADQHSVHTTAATAIGYLTDRDIDFKIALDLNIFEMLTSKGMSRGSGGKLVTIYPRDDDQFNETLVDLAKVLEDSSGGYILSDLRYRDSTSVYFRYGQFLNTHTVDAMGNTVAHITDPEGNRVADNRLPAFSRPEWAPWPIPDWRPAEDAEPLGLLGGRFRVVEALTFSNSGGLYKAEDTADADRVVVLKEARPGTNVNPREQHDAVDILHREWDFLNRLADVGLFPAPITTFVHWEHSFIAEELIDGTDIRTILFDHNPLVRLGFGTAESRGFLEIWLKIFRGLALAVSAAHRRNVVLGDLTAANLLVQPDTFEVKVIDLEACRLIESDAADAHLSRPVDLFTPGFSRSRAVGKLSDVGDDLYGLATTMAYLVFPIAAMSYLRDDVFALYRHYLDDLGWPADVHELLVGLAEGTTSLDEALAVVSEVDDLVGRVEVVPPEPVVEAELRLAEVERGLAAFVGDSADPGRDTLFPTDPFAHVTNPLSLGFGATGVLFALDASGVPLRAEWTAWVREQLGTMDPDECSVGLLNGLAGMAWATDAIGLRTESDVLVAAADAMLDRTSDHTYYYGLAGLGMTYLQLWTRRRDDRFLAAADRCAQRLCAEAHHDGELVYWLNEFSTDGPLTGLGFGQAGPALFLLRMHQAGKKDPYLRTGRQALDWELAHAVPWHEGSLTFRHDKTVEPYVEVGGAGVAQVLLRYRDLGSAEKVLRGLRLRNSILPGYVFGMSGIVDTMLDAAAVLRDSSYRRTALDQFHRVRTVFLFEPDTEPDTEPDSEPSTERVEPDVVRLAVPGEGLLRCATDLATGSAGVLRVAHRLRHGGTADLMLDQLGL